jgi:hypothetical protein
VLSSAALSIGLSIVTTLAPAAVQAAGTTPAWLAKINQIRAGSGLAPVTINAMWTAGIQAHLVYMAKTPDSYRTGQYASIHTENPQSPYYTQAGATEAGKSNLIQGAANGEVNSINTWLSVPFHAIGILRPQLKEVALAVDSKSGMAGLDVISGLDQSQPLPTTPVLFPGDGSVSDIPIFGGNEVPDPMETCGPDRYRSPGLPLVVLLPSSPAQGLSASLAGPGGTSIAPGSDLCVVDQDTFKTSDPVYGGTGGDILAGEKAVFLVPRKPLTAGHYTATIHQPGQPDITWSFDSAPQTMPPQLAPTRMVCAWAGDADGRAVVTVVHLEDYAATGHYLVRLGSATKSVTAPDRGTANISFGGLKPGTYTVRGTGTYDAVRTITVTIPKCTATLAAWATVGKPDWSARTVPVTLDNRHNHKKLTYSVLTGQGSTLTTKKDYSVAAGARKKVEAHLPAGHRPVVLVSIGDHVVTFKQWKH